MFVLKRQLVVLTAGVALSFIGLMLHLHLIHVARIQVVSTYIDVSIIAVYMYPVSATKLSSRLQYMYSLQHLYPRADPYADVDGVGGGVWVNFHRRRRRADDF